MCLVRRLWLPTVANAMAPWLSIAIGIGGRWLSSCCGWGREVAGAPGGSISVSRYRNHVASRAASNAAMYSASHVDHLFPPRGLVLGHFSPNSFVLSAFSSRTFLLGLFPPSSLVLSFALCQDIPLQLFFPAVPSSACLGS
jgi:hypothetical protein